jgi:precorrin-2 dehydrogenase/sirohydrochlorin ferrochelatase
MAMVPIVLDPKNVRMAVIGQGPAMERRVHQLRNGGADVATYDFAAGQVPSETELAGIQVVFVAGLDADVSAELTQSAKAVGALVNVEDLTHQCDFHMPAVVRRGDLLLTASTGGKSPGLARHLRRSLEGQFGEDWAGIVDQVAVARQDWIKDGDDMKSVAAKTEQLIEQNGWLA